MTHPGNSPERRAEIAKGQHPFAVVVGCSDSRVPPELLFDQGLGDLFVVRLAGNILSDEALGSIEYAVDHLNVRYLMVLGHQRCGAVEAAVKGGHAEGQIGSLLRAVGPAVQKAGGMAGDRVENIVVANVGLIVDRLKTSPPILKDLVEKGELVIEGARYDLEEGTVKIVQ
ncbi:MAG TPA: carbonic anhydrase [Acidobacteriota bacterium]|nr:carbonic anhydrase [Acidobacteriota bacterium]HPA27450.1 carbonic anhydrase [Acidobacteriota bacterium]